MVEQNGRMGDTPLRTLSGTGGTQPPRLAMTEHLKWQPASQRTKTLGSQLAGLIQRKVDR